MKDHSNPDQTLSDCGEEALLKRLFPPKKPQGSDLIVGIGDDCAVVDVGRGNGYQLLKTDAVVQGVHFLADELPVRVGKKAINRVASDCAAMGGRLDAVLVTLAAPENTPVERIVQLYEGMEAACQESGARIVGGETTSLPRESPLLLSIAATGWVKKKSLTMRSGGQVGDLLWVTGRLGGSLQGKHLDFSPRLREGQWLGAQSWVSAMMDLSDGLAKDLPRLAQASQTSYSIDRQRIPKKRGCLLKQALGDGEDYELLFASHGQLESTILKAWQDTFDALELSCIGRLESPAVAPSTLAGGWEHFTSPIEKK